METERYVVIKGSNERLFAKSLHWHLTRGFNPIFETFKIELGKFYMLMVKE